MAVWTTLHESRRQYGDVVFEFGRQWVLGWSTVNMLGLGRKRQIRSPSLLWFLALDLQLHCRRAQTDANGSSYSSNSWKDPRSIAPGIPRPSKESGKGAVENLDIKWRNSILAHTHIPTVVAVVLCCVTASSWAKPRVCWRVEFGPRRRGRQNRIHRKVENWGKRRRQSFTAAILFCAIVHPFLSTSKSDAVNVCWFWFRRM